LRIELARTLSLAGQLSEATDLYFDLYEDGYSQPIVLAYLAVSLLEEGRVSEAILAGRAAVLGDSSLLFARSNLLFALCCCDKVDPAALFQEHLEFGKLFPSPQPPVSRRRAGKIRVGFLCAWFNSHPVGRFSFPVVKSLDRSRFEVHCYFAGKFDDPVTGAFREASDHWRVITELDDTLAFEALKEDDLDILIELDGHTGGNRLSLVAQKPARTVISWLGYPNTTGLPAVDYRIVDQLTDPEPLASAVNSETLIKLEAPFVVFSALDSPPVSRLPALQNGRVTFGVFGQALKHSECAVEAVSRVALAVPGSRLKILASACRDQKVKEAVVNRFASRGIPVENIDCSGARGTSEYLAAHHEVDVILDTFPFNGATTTCESLWMGVPRITLQGLTHRERVSSSFLTAAGYPELVATGVDEYVEIARGLANDLPRLAEMRATMRDKLLASPLMDIPAFVKRFEDALVRVFSAHDS